MNSSTSRSKKFLGPLAVLLVAGALAVGSGATFTSTSSNTISSVTSGSLSHTNSKNDDAIFTLTDMKPGDTLNGELTITNTGTLPATFSLTELDSTNGFTGDNLTLVVTNETTGAVVYTGAFGGLEDGVRTDLGQIAPGAANVFDFEVALSADADNTQQGKTASALYTWDSVQLGATATEQ